MLQPEKFFRKIKGNEIEMEKVKLSQFAYDMILYISKNLQKTVRANKFSKVAAYKINTQKPFVF